MIHESSCEFETLDYSAVSEGVIVCTACHRQWRFEGVPRGWQAYPPFKRKWNGPYKPKKKR